MQQVAQQHRAGVDIQDLAHAVGGVIVKEFVQPLEGVPVGLAHAAKVAGNGGRAAQVHVGAVGALGVQGLHVAGANDLHGGDEGRQVAVLLLLLHLAHADEPAGNQRLLGDGPLDRRHQPGEILRRAHFQRHRAVVLKGHAVGLRPQHLAPVIGHGDKNTVVPLLRQPVQVVQKFGAHLGHFFAQNRQLPGGGGPGVDLFRCAIPGHHRQKIINHAHVGVQQHGV